MSRYREEDLREWAFAIPIESTRQVGADRARLVLLKLVEYAAGDGLAYPSAQTLADGVSGLTRRDVRNAFDALEAQGLIDRITAPRRSVTWVVRPAGDVAGNVAGDMAGDLAGVPATNRREPNSTRPSAGSSAPRASLAELDELRALLDDLGSGLCPLVFWWHLRESEGARQPVAWARSLAGQGWLDGYLANTGPDEYGECPADCPGCGAVPVSCEEPAAGRRTAAS